MTLKVCKECSYVFPEELSNLIDNGVQVFCEQCGIKFAPPGINLKDTRDQYKKGGKKSYTLSEKETSSLDKAIQFFNKVSFIPILIYSCFAFIFITEISSNPAGWIYILPRQILVGLSSLFICIYDINYIIPKVKQRKYNDILIDAFCYGVLGCVLYGIGCILLLKGVLIFFRVITASENKNLKAYNFGLLLKNSLNNFSTKAGFIIILIVSYAAVIGDITIITISLPLSGGNFPNLFTLLIPFMIFGGFLIISIIALLIDLKMKKSIREKQEFNLSDSFQTFFIGIFATIFYSAGIFVLLKGILMFFLYVGKPSEVKPSVPIEEKESYRPPVKVIVEESIKLTPELKKAEVIEQVRTPVPQTVSPKIEQEKIVKLEEELPSRLKEEEIKLKLHESLLPVKDEKDKKLVKRYFTKIFAVLSKDVRKKIIDLKISKKEKKELLEELAFLTKEEQIKYVEELIELSKEIPKRLLERIRKLPNVKPEHYGNIINQLKYMDYEEQLSFVQYLENIA